jgi:hypothetical protein
VLSLLFHPDGMIPVIVLAMKWQQMLSARIVHVEGNDLRGTLRFGGKAQKARRRANVEHPLAGAGTLPM